MPKAAIELESFQEITTLGEIGARIIFFLAEGAKR
jgi:hypothetical protein